MTDYRTQQQSKGIYSKDVATRFPLREWGWNRADVLAYLERRGVSIPSRTDCARCYGQRLSEWHTLWSEHPELWADAEKQEAETGHTFRSAQRDTWPAGLAELRQRFEAGDKPKLRVLNNAGGACRVCRM